MGPYLDSEVFVQLKEDGNFSKVHNGKYFVEWDCGADLSADTIYPLPIKIQNIDPL